MSTSTFHSQLSKRSIREIHHLVNMIDIIIQAFAILFGILNGFIFKMTIFLKISDRLVARWIRTQQRWYETDPKVNILIYDSSYLP